MAACCVYLARKELNVEYWTHRLIAVTGYDEKTVRDQARKFDNEYTEFEYENQKVLNRFKMNRNYDSDDSDDSDDEQDDNEDDGVLVKNGVTPSQECPF